MTCHRLASAASPLLALLGVRPARGGSPPVSVVGELEGLNRRPDRPDAVAETWRLERQPHDSSVEPVTALAAPRDRLSRMPLPSSRLGGLLSAWGEASPQRTRRSPPRRESVDLVGPRTMIVAGASTNSPATRLRQGFVRRVAIHPSDPSPDHATYTGFQERDSEHEPESRREGAPAVSDKRRQRSGLHPPRLEPVRQLLNRVDQRPWLTALLLAAAVGLVASPGDAQLRHVAGRFGPPLLPAGFHELAGTDPELPYDDLAPLADMIGDASFVGLGESVHTSGGFYEAKHRLLRWLVEEQRFRVLGMESPWVSADLVGNYVATGEGTAEEAMEGLYPVWEAESVLAMVEWMRAWNVAHPEDPVYFYGFDTVQPDVDGAALIAFLEQVHDDPDALTVGLERCSGVGGRWFPVNANDNQACLAALADVEAYFVGHRDEIIAASSSEELDWAWVRLVSVRAWQGLARGETLDDYEAAYESRDWGMAEVLLRIHALRYEGLKTVIWAHNWHLAQHTDLMETDAEWGLAHSMGTHLAATLGAGYAPVALAAYRARIHWPWVEPEPIEFVPTEGVEVRLHALQRAVMLIDADSPALCPRNEACLWTWPDYAATTLDWAMWRFVFDPPEQFRAVLYLDVSREMTPLP